MPRRGCRPRVDRRSLKRHVLTACLACLAEGRIPSERQLRDRISGHGQMMLIELRDELRAEGKIAWPRVGRPDQAVEPCGLMGRTPAERQEVQDRAAAIRAEKMAAEPQGLKPLPLVEQVRREYPYPVFAARQRGGDR